MPILMGLLNKFWPYILIVALVLFGLNWYGDKRYDEGHAAASAEYEKANADALAVKVQELKDQKAAYEKQINAANDKTNEAYKAKDTAETEARKYREKSNYYYSQWERVKHEIPTITVNGPHYFTHGFVGLYNLAVRLPESDKGVHSGTAGNSDNGPEIGLPEVAEAAGLERGASTADLARQSSVDEDDILYNVKFNYGIANTCLEERKLINNYFNELCKLGFCEQ